MKAGLGQLRRARRRFFGVGRGVSELFEALAEIRFSPRFRGVRWLSAVALLLLAVQLVTGVLLSLYQYPAPGAAYDSTRHLTGELATGWLIRSVHHWAGELLVAAVAVHVLATFVRRAYRRPREIVWVVGVLLFPAVLAARFTGPLLRWDTIAFDAARAGLDVLANVPVIGSLAAQWLRGGQDLGANTLSRFFATHVLILPWLLSALLALHLWLVRRHGLSEDEA